MDTKFRELERRLVSGDISVETALMAEWNRQGRPFSAKILSYAVFGPANNKVVHCHEAFALKGRIYLGIDTDHLQKTLNYIAPLSLKFQTVVIEFLTKSGGILCSPHFTNKRMTLNPDRVTCKNCQSRIKRQYERLVEAAPPNCPDQFEKLLFGTAISLDHVERMLLEISP